MKNKLSFINYRNHSYTLMACFIFLLASCSNTDETSVIQPETNLTSEVTPPADDEGLRLLTFVGGPAATSMTARYGGNCPGTSIGTIPVSYGSPAADADHVYLASFTFDKNTSAYYYIIPSGGSKKLKIKFLSNYGLCSGYSAPQFSYNSTTDTWTIPSHQCADDFTASQVTTLPACD